MKKITLLLAVLFTITNCRAQSIPDSLRRSPAELPGKGLAQHDFFYAGENSKLNMYMVRAGKVVWSYTHPREGEISDAVMLSNGNILFAWRFGVTEITPDKQVIWNYNAPPGCEIHTAQPIGNDHVWFIQNGNPAKCIVMNLKTGETEREFELPVANPGNVHGQFRHARLTGDGTLLVAHMDLGKVVEYNIKGEALWSVPFPGLWAAEPLKNGHVLVAGNNLKMVCEMNKKGDTVWKFSATELPDYKFSGMQTAVRIYNGNTIINSWSGKGNGTAVQAIEVSRDKKLVWVLRSWDKPADLGPSTIIQVLDKKEIPEAVHFGDIK